VNHGAELFWQDHKGEVLAHKGNALSGEHGGGCWSGGCL
jgi:hypothetical protein